MEQARRSPAGLARLATSAKWERARHLDLLNEYLKAVSAREVDRLIITMPPRHGKSMLTSQFFPPWLLGRNPDWRVILASYEAGFAADWGRKARDVMEHWGPAVFGVSVRRDSKSASSWNIAGREGGMECIGTGGPATGKGADCFLIDDPVKNAEEANSEVYRNKVWNWYTSTAYTRLSPRGSVIVIMCMVGETPVLMANGAEKPLKYVRPGDVIATYDEGHISTSVVRNWKNQGLDAIYEIKTKSGRIVRANERHPFLVETGGGTRWVRLRDLKVGDGIVAATPRGGRCVASHAPRTGANNPRNARDSACPTTARPARRRGSGRLRKTRPLIGLVASSIVTGLRRSSTMPSSPPRTGSVPSAADPPARTSGLIGAESSASTTTTPRARSEGCSVTTATSWSGMGRPRRYSSGPLATFGTTPDHVVSIASAGYAEVFDIEVEGTENFIAGGLVSHNTRWHEDDLSGRILANSARTGETWHHLHLRAIATDDGPDALGRSPGEALWPERWPVERLERTRRTQDDPDAGLVMNWFEAQYQGDPVPARGELFDTAWFSQLVDAVPAHGKRVRYWDKAATAGGGARTAGVKMSRSSDGLFYVEDVIKGQWSATDREAVIKRTAQLDGPTVRVVFEQEPGSGGKESAEATVRNLAGFPCEADRVTGDKTARATPFASQAQAGNVRLLRGDWIGDYLAELSKFPRGKFKDQVDASSGAFNKLTSAPEAVAVVGGRRPTLATAGRMSH